MKNENSNLQFIDFIKELEPGMIELDTLDGFPVFDKSDVETTKEKDDLKQKQVDLDDTIEIEVIKDETE